MQTELSKIREQLGYSFREMAADLGLNAATYQGYEIGRRECPEHVLLAAQTTLEIDRKLTADLPGRVDANLRGGFCPNEARG